MTKPQPIEVRLITQPMDTHGCAPQSKPFWFPSVLACIKFYPETRDALRPWQDAPHRTFFCPRCKALVLCPTKAG